MGETVNAAIEVRGLRKDYRAGLGGREVKALSGIDLAVQPGELFGLLGPNGAGKTTTVKILLGLTHATAGSASLLGRSVGDPESRRRVGYLPEGHRFPGYLTARQTLSIFGRMSGVAPRTLAPRIEDLLSRLKLSDWIDVKVRKFSKGMTQRLGLAAALVHEPDVLLLDEPTDGVDPVGRREIRDLLKAEAAKGRAILLNSHLLSEIELTCDRVAVLRNGRVAAMGTIEELTKREEKKDSSKGYKLAASPISEELLSDFFERGASPERVNGHVRVLARDAQHLNSLIDAARARGALLTELTPEKSSLEDVFVDLVRAPDSPEKGS
ncbi:MAG TPA: ABC transporter ATP-binding protein [Thermoanaerobaculia bacterium]|nr:ABC transporter ATP-binding protein [Thermoanaerobaculia bacterium]